jgi:hypothetical protein
MATGAMKAPLKSVLFVAAVPFFSALATYVMVGMIDFRNSAYWPAVLWVAGFFLLALNASHMLVCSIVALLPREPHLRESEDCGGRTVDLLYVVRSENTDLLFSTMSGSFSGNRGPGVRLWLLSNTDHSEFQNAERGLIRRLRQTFGDDRVGFFESRLNPLRRKHTCIHEWLDAYPEV